MPCVWWVGARPRQALLRTAAPRRVTLPRPMDGHKSRKKSATRWPMLSQALLFCGQSRLFTGGLIMLERSLIVDRYLNLAVNQPATIGGVVNGFQRVAVTV